MVFKERTSCSPDGSVGQVHFSQVLFTQSEVESSGGENVAKREAVPGFDEEGRDGGGGRIRRVSFMVTLRQQISTLKCARGDGDNLAQHW